MQQTLQYPYKKNFKCKIICAQLADPQNIWLSLIGYFMSHTIMQFNILQFFLSHLYIKSMIYQFYI